MEITKFVGQSDYSVYSVYKMELTYIHVLFQWNGWLVLFSVFNNKQMLAHSHHIKAESQIIHIEMAHTERDSDKGMVLRLNFQNGYYYCSL